MIVAFLIVALLIAMFGAAAALAENEERNARPWRDELERDRQARPEFYAQMAEERWARQAERADLEYKEAMRRLK